MDKTTNDLSIQTSMYVATLRVAFEAADDVQAALFAEHFRQQIEDDLDTEDEAAVLTSLTDVYVGDTPEELLVSFRSTRNALIKTKFRPAIEVARQLEEIIQALAHGDLQLLTPFDHGRFMDVMEEIYTGGWPQ